MGAPRRGVLARTLPVGPPQRILTVATFVNTLGSGMYMTSSALYFTRIAGLSAGQVAVGLFAAAMAGLASGVVAGKMADRWDAKGTQIAVMSFGAITACGFVLVRSFWTFLLISVLMGLVYSADSASRAPLIRALGGERPAVFRGYLRSVSNLSMAIGAALAAFAVEADTRPAYVLVMMGRAAAFLGCALVLLRLPHTASAGRSGERRNWIALRDRPYLTATLANAVMSLHLAVPTFLLPLWIANYTHAPRWMLSGVLILNTVLVILLQVRVSRGVLDPESAGRRMWYAGVALLIGLTLMALAHGRSPISATLLLVAGMTSYTLGELWHMAASTEYSFGLAPAHAQGQYAGVFGLGSSFAYAVGPTVMSALPLAYGLHGWLVLGGIFVAAGFACQPMVSRAARHTAVRPEGEGEEVMAHMPPSAPSLLLVGGASPLSTSIDITAMAIAQARARGIRTHLTNRREILPLIPDTVRLADEVSAVDPDDAAASACWARARQAEGARFDMVLGLRDTVQLAVAATAEVLGTAGNPAEAVQRVRHKDACREALARAGFRQPRVLLCREVEQAARFLRTTQGPWVVKPRDAMGSIGVRKVAGTAELGEAVAGLPDQDCFLVEQFVEGTEFSVEGAFFGGRPRVLAVTEKHKLPPPHFVEIGHVLPAELPDERVREIDREVSNAVTALGLRVGVFHIELWLTGAGVVLGEVHVRPGGGWLHRLLTYAIPGLELFGLVYDDMLGHPAPPPGQLAPTRGAAAFFFAPPAGRLAEVRGWDGLAAHPAVLHAELRVRPGDMLASVRQSADRAGAVVVGGPSARQARQLAQELTSTVEFVME